MVSYLQALVAQVTFATPYLTLNELRFNITQCQVTVKGILPSQSLRLVVNKLYLIQ